MDSEIVSSGQMPVASDHPPVGAAFRPRPKPARIQAGRKGLAPAHPWTEAQDALLRKIFGTTNLADRKAAYKTLMPKLHPHTPRAAAKRAQTLGWAVPIYIERRAWTAEEDALVESFAHLSLGALSARLRRKGYHRTPHGICKRRLELAGYQHDNRIAAGYYSTAEAAELLGMGAKVIERFCRDGTITADREPTTQPNLPGYRYRIRAVHLREFVIHYTAHIRLDKIDKFAFVDLLCPSHGIKAHGHTHTVGVAEEL